MTLDCADPRPLAEFWAAIPGGEVMFTTATTVGVRTDWTWIATIGVPDYQPPTWPGAGVPKQIHLDLAVGGLDAAVAEVHRLGAIPAAFQPARGQRRILFDPAGHPFCLTTQIPREAL